MSRHHTAQEGDGLCVPEMNRFRSKMCEPTPETEDLGKIVSNDFKTISNNFTSNKHQLNTYYY